MLEKGGGGGGGGGSPYYLNSTRRVPLRLRQSVFFRPLTTSKLLLLSSCAAFALLLISTGWADRGHSSRSSFLHPRTGYTILINTWKRNDLLQQSISHYASCGGVESIRIVWSEPDPPSYSLRDSLLQSVFLNSEDCKDIDLKFLLNQEDSLNNRFKDIDDLRTDAIFSVDDDVLFPCTSLELAYSVWTTAPSSMVGFVPRMHRLIKSNEGKFKYRGWWSVWWTGTYSMVLSKAAFFHRKYLDIYTNKMHPAIREYVTINRNCEDIAMSFLIANETGVPPIWVKGKMFEIGSTGISSLGGHSERRSKCLNDFVAIYGYMPLVATNVKVIDSRYSWLW